MKIDKLNLGSALTRVRCAVNPKHGYYSHVLLEADEEIRLTATNGSLFVRSNVDSGLIVEPGSVLIDAAKLSQLDKLNKPFDIEQENQIVHIKCGRSRLKFPIITADFPRIDEPFGEPWLELDLDAIDRVLYAAAAPNSGRSEFESISMQVRDKGFVFVSTNAYRLSEFFYESDLSDFKPILLPAESLNLCKVLFSKMKSPKFWIDGSQCKIQFEQTLITMRLLEGNFPDYSPIIPKNAACIINVNVEELREALQVIGIAEGDKHFIGMEVEDIILHLWAFSGTYQASETIKITGKIDPFKTGINSKYLYEALSHVSSETVEIHVPDPATSILILDPKNTNHRQVIACMTPPANLP